MRVFSRHFLACFKQAFGIVCVVSLAVLRSAGAEGVKADWVQAVDGARGKGGAGAVLPMLESEFPVQWDWVLQDAGGDAERFLASGNEQGVGARMIRGVIKQLGDRGNALRGELEGLEAAKTPAKDVAWLKLYDKVCQERRSARLEALPGNARRIVFTKHYNLGGSHYAYTEGQSDAQDERHFIPGASLCLLEISGTNIQCRTLLHDDQGVIRDPAVSFDGQRVLFAWKKSDLKDDYHLYEMRVDTGEIRQLTQGLGFVDYEGSYLPNGDIVFNSTRCGQIVDCWWTEVSNLYTCDKDGRYLRRLAFDQVHDNYPTVMDDGRVIYTRWEYNDRGQIYPQALFQMNSDGTGQTEFYGNNSWFPTSVLHARGIPGTSKVMGIASGHHTLQAGKLIVLDPSKGRQEAEGAQLIAPVRETKAEQIDVYGQTGDLFQYPYPLSEDSCLVSYHPQGWSGDHARLRFKIYWMRANGDRELLWGAADSPCNQPVLLASRPVPTQRPGLVDYRKATGTYLVQDIYAGEALKGVSRGTVKRLRVVSIGFRAAGIGQNGSSGPAGGALSSSPVSIDNGAWDTKTILGDAGVYEDGSAFFEIPARVPVYFQALDQSNHVVQTMRSWSTLQPGENASCVGCHENKNSSATSSGKPLLALQAGLKPLKPFYGPTRAFSFSREIQPILDRSCVRCHKDRSGSQHNSTNVASFLAVSNPDSKAGRAWTDGYLALTHHGKFTPMVNWFGAQSVPSMLPPWFAGSAKSGIITMLEKGRDQYHVSTEDIEKFAAWIDLMVPYCADYREANIWTSTEVQKYDHYLMKRRRMAEMETASIRELIALRNGSQPATTIELVDGGGRTLATNAAFHAGDRLRISGPPRMMIRLGRQAPEFLVYSPEGFVEIPIPGGAEANAYPPNAFTDGLAGCSARPATEADIAGYRNVALNPFDPRGDSSFFPHAESNSECRNEPVFGARNAIDGHRDNTGHGAWPFQSWGPDQRGDLWWKVDFGRRMHVDKLVITLRADFPHDQAWPSATVHFSDGAAQRIELRKTAEPQTFDLTAHDTSWVQLDEFGPPNGWCAITEVEVYGREDTGQGPVMEQANRYR